MQKSYLLLLNRPVAVPTAYDQLPTYLLRILVKYLYTEINLSLLNLLIINFLPYPNWLYKAYSWVEKKLRPTLFITTRQPLTHKITHQTHQLLTTDGILYRQTSLCFAEFIVLLDLYQFLTQAFYAKDLQKQRLILTKILATVFRPQNQTYNQQQATANETAILQLNHELKIYLASSIRADIDKVIDQFPTLFQKKDYAEQNQKPKNRQPNLQNWLKVVRALAENITNFEKILQTNAAIILFEYQQALEEQKEC